MPLPTVSPFLIVNKPPPLLLLLIGVSLPQERSTAEKVRRKMPGPPIALVWATSADRQFTGHQYQIPYVWATRTRYPCLAHQYQPPQPCHGTFTTQFQINLNWIQFNFELSRGSSERRRAPAAHDCALGGAPERRGAFGPRPADQPHATRSGAFAP